MFIKTLFLFLSILLVNATSSFRKISLDEHYSGKNNRISDKLLRMIPEELEDEVYLKVPDIIRKYKYPVEVHHLVTEDGYILTLHRIPRGRSGRSRNGTVLVMHGILASSADWIITGTQTGLGYILADAGYDVWLGNARGNRYSRNHTTLNPEGDDFWDFSWHQIGYYDVPAMIDYIVEETKQEKIFYVAHSQGSTSFYVMCSERPEYNNKIRAHVALAPVGFIKNLKSPLLKALANFNNILFSLTKILGIKEFLSTNSFISKFMQTFCGLGGWQEELCKNTLFLICGFNSAQLNSTILPLILAHVPAGASTKQFVHFAQEYKSGKFRQFDYGFFYNKYRYGSWTPPAYKLKNIKVPVYFFHSKNDWISVNNDIINLGRGLPNLKGSFWVSDEKFNHLDFLFGIESPKVLYNKVISIFARH